MFLDSGSLLILSHLRVAHHTVLFYVVFVWRYALCLVRYSIAQDTGHNSGDYFNLNISPQKFLIECFNSDLNSDLKNKKWKNAGKNLKRERCAMNSL
jgi:hypothetical protein